MRMGRALEGLEYLNQPVELKDDTGRPLVDQKGKPQTRSRTFEEKLMGLVKAGAGIPGWMNVVETLAPMYMKAEQAGAASDVLGADKAGGVTAESQVPGYRFQRDMPLEENIDRLVEREQNYATTSSQLPEDLISEVPRFGESTPAYDVPTSEQMISAINRYRSAGKTEEEAFRLMERDQQRKRQEYQSLMDDYQRRLGEYANKRGLEEEQRRFVDDNAIRYLMQRGIGNGDPNQVPEYYKDIAYRQFQAEKDRNKQKKGSATDQKLWSQARQQLDQLLEHEASGQQIAKPWLPLSPAVKDAAKRTKAWVDKYKQMAGNTPEVRDHLETSLMDNGWSRHKAKEFIQPMSNKLQSEYNKIPKMPRSVSVGASPQAAESTQRKLGQSQQKRMEQIQAMVPELARSFSNIDSPYLLRNKLVREKGLNQYQANEIIEALGEQGNGFTPAQQKEMSYLGDRATRDLDQIFWEWAE
jgi:hypothetical protein